MRILFKVFPQKSHYNATFSLARALRDSGHEILYAGLVQMRSHAEAQGFAYYVETEDVFPYFENKRNLPRLTFWNTLKNWREIRRSARNIRPKIMRGDFFEALLRATRPELVLVDSPYTFFALSLFRQAVPFAMLESMMNLDRAPNIPPMDTAYVPRETLLSRVFCALHWRRYFLKRAILGFLGLRIDFDRRFVLSMAQAWGANIQAISFDRYFHLGIRNIPELILSSRTLDFPRVPAPNQYYIGLPPDPNRLEAESDYRFKEVFRRIVAERLQGRPLVYCSLGTGAWRYAGAEQFIHNVIKAADGKHWNLIITVGDFPLEQFANRSANVEVFQIVPQLTVLLEADLMITHGGMNSILECSTYGVPMVVCPGTSEIDQAGNAARVVYHRLGLKCSISGAGAPQISEMVDSIISKKNQFKRLSQIEPPRTASILPFALSPLPTQNSPAFANIPFVN